MTQFKARPTTYKGIKMRSRLEAGFAAWLDRMHVEWTYEPQCFANENGQYLPDFQLHDVTVAGEIVNLFIEVKPSPPDVELLINQSAILCSCNPGAFLVAIWPHGAGFQSFFVLDDGVCPALWVKRRAGRLALECELSPDESPWHGEYWKPKTS